jgi:signal transduction histidine kinase
MIEGLEQLHRRLDEAERSQVLAQERDRIAAELHDLIEQGIFTIGLQLSSLLEDEADPATAARLHDLRQLAGRTAESVREAIFALKRPGHDAANLTASVRRLLREVSKAHELETDLVVSGEPTAAVAAVAHTLTTVIGEALANVTRHARARMVLVSVRYAPEQVDVVIQDDGVGAPEMVLHSYRESHLHFGLRHMREQIVGLGGDFHVVNGEESGLTLRLSVPLAERPG